MGEDSFHFDMADMARKGQDSKDYICPDRSEKHGGYLKLGDAVQRNLAVRSKTDGNGEAHLLSGLVKCIDSAVQ